LGAFKNTLRLLVILGVVASLAKRKPGKGGDSDSGSSPKRPRGGDGQSGSTAEIQQKAKANAEALDPNRATSDGSDPNDPDGDDPGNPNDLPRDENGRPIVDRDDKDALRDLFALRDENGRIPDDQLPEGWGYRKDGLLHDENGWPVRDPDKPYTSDRDKYFPSGFSQNTHNEMVRRYTAEGAQPDGTTGSFPAGHPKPDSPAVNYRMENGVPVDTATGKPVPRDRLSWEDNDGNPIPYYRTNSKGETVTNLTYDHETPVVEYWNKEGYQQPWTERERWYNDPDNLVPMGSKDNSSKSGESTDGQDYRYKDREPSGGYTPKGTK
jgi:hypothetical protein